MHVIAGDVFLGAIISATVGALDEGGDPLEAPPQDNAFQHHLNSAQSIAENWRNVSDRRENQKWSDGGKLRDSLALTGYLEFSLPVEGQI